MERLFFFQFNMVSYTICAMLIYANELVVSQHAVLTDFVCLKKKNNQCAIKFAIAILKTCLHHGLVTPKSWSTGKSPTDKNIIDFEWSLI